MSFKTRRLLQIIFLAAIFLAIPFTFILVQTVQDYRSRADSSTGGVPVGMSSGCCSSTTECQIWFGSESTCSNGNGACVTGVQCKGGAPILRDSDQEAGPPRRCTEKCTNSDCGRWICEHQIRCDGGCTGDEAGERYGQSPKFRSNCNDNGVCESNNNENATTCPEDCVAAKSKDAATDGKPKKPRSAFGKILDDAIEIARDFYSSLTEPLQQQYLKSASDIDSIKSTYEVQECTRNSKICAQIDSYEGYSVLFTCGCSTSKAGRVCTWRYIDVVRSGDSRCPRG